MHSYARRSYSPVDPISTSTLTSTPTPIQTTNHVKPHAILLDSMSDDHSNWITIRAIQCGLVFSLVSVLLLAARLPYPNQGLVEEDSSEVLEQASEESTLLYPLASQTEDQFLTCYAQWRRSMIQDIFEDAPNALIEGDRYLSAKLRTEKVNSKSEARERRGQVQGQGQGQGQASDGDDLSCAGYSQFDAEARGLLIWSPKAGLGDSLGSLTMSLLLAMSTNMILLVDWPEQTWGQLLTSPMFEDSVWEWQKLGSASQEHFEAWVNSSFPEKCQERVRIQVNHFGIASEDSLDHMIECLFDQSLSTASFAELRNIKATRRPGMVSIDTMPRLDRSTITLRLIGPSALVEAEMKEMQRQIGNKRLIGVQIRSGQEDSSRGINSFNNDEEITTDDYLTALLTIRDAVVSKEGVDPSEVACFITSDESEIKSDLVTKAMSHGITVFSQQGGGRHIAYQSASFQRDDGSQIPLPDPELIRSIADFFILSHSHYGIATKASLFGSVALNVLGGLNESHLVEVGSRKYMQEGPISLTLLNRRVKDTSSKFHFLGIMVRHECGYMRLMVFELRSMAPGTTAKLAASDSIAKEEHTIVGRSCAEGERDRYSFGRGPWNDEFGIEEKRREEKQASERADE